MQSDDFADDATEYDPSPWGSRQRVLPKRGFKAVASVMRPLPGLPPRRATTEQPIAQAAPAAWSIAAPAMQPAVAKSAAMQPPPIPHAAPLYLDDLAPILRERDIPTWRVEKLPAPAKRRGIDLRPLRRWLLPIVGLASVLVIAICATRLSASNASAALVPHSASIATIEPIEMQATPAQPSIEMKATPAPVAAPAPQLAIAEPAPALAPRVVARPTAKPHQYAQHVSHARPKLDMNTATPLGDLVKHR